MKHTTKFFSVINWLRPIGIVRIVFLIGAIGLWLLVLLFKKRLDNATEQYQELKSNLEKLQTVNKQIRNEDFPTQSNSNLFGVGSMKTTVKNRYKTSSNNLNFDIGPLAPTDTINLFKGSQVWKWPAIILMLEHKYYLYADGIRTFAPLHIYDGKLFIKTDIVDLNGDLIVTIDNNKVFKNENYKGIINYDNKGVEVIDRFGNVAFSIDIRGDMIIYQGYVVDQLNNSIFISGINLMVNFNVENIKYLTTYLKVAGVKKIFDYSYNPPIIGKRAQPFSLGSELIQVETK